MGWHPNETILKNCRAISPEAKVERLINNGKPVVRVSYKLGDKSIEASAVDDAAGVAGAGTSAPERKLLQAALIALETHRYRSVPELTPAEAERHDALFFPKPEDQPATVLRSALTKEGIEQ